MKRLLLTFFSLLFAVLSIFSQETDEVVANLRHQILDYPQEKIFVQLDRPQYEAGDTIWFRAHTVSEAFHLPSAMSRGIFVNLYGPDHKLIERFTLFPMDKRLYSSFMVLPEQLPEGDYTLQVYSEQMEGKRSNAYFTKSFPVRNPVRKYQASARSSKNDYDIQFYPEGGKLVDKHNCKVAFTIKNPKGKLVEIKGAVYETNGAAVAMIRTLRPGIGCFTLPVQAGKSYYALLETGDEKPWFVELPAVAASGYSLQVADMVDTYYVSALQSGAEKLSRSLNVLLLLRGVPERTFRLTPEHDFIYIGKEELESGVHELILLDENNRVQSQRLLFIQNDDQANVQIVFKSDSTKKKQVTFDLSVSDADGTPMDAECSVAIYPDTLSAPLMNRWDIGSEFLLGSDLTQHKALISSCFEGLSNLPSTILDAWLVASRWPKFDIQRAIDGNFESSWDIGESPEAAFIRDTTGIYSPLTTAEKIKKEKLRQVDLKAVNVYPEQLNKHIKPYNYVNHTVTGEELLTGGVTVEDYLVNLPGVTYDYNREVLLIRDGSVSYMIDGYNADFEAVNMLAVSEIESIDVLKDPGNMGLFKFSSSDSSNTAVGGVVAVWTKRALDATPQKTKKNFNHTGPKISDDVQRKIMPGTTDIWLSQFPNTARSNGWKPSVVTDDQGKAVIRFTPAENCRRYVVEMNGVTSTGKLLFFRKSIELPVP
jgi:hypothetical protein